MDDQNKIIDDWLSGEEIDPTDYDAYQIEELKHYLGYDDNDSDSKDEFKDGGWDDLESEGYEDDCYSDDE